eukprot:6608993-Prymnesium_polylepis.2
MLSTIARARHKFRGRCHGMPRATKQAVGLAGAPPSALLVREDEVEVIAGSVVGCCFEPSDDRGERWIPFQRNFVGQDRRGRFQVRVRCVVRALCCALCTCVRRAHDARKQRAEDREAEEALHECESKVRRD